MYGCDTWSLTLTQERRLRVFENRVLRIFQCKGDEVTGVCTELRNEELNNLYYSSNIIQVVKSRIRWAGHVARIEELYTGFC